MRPALRGSRLRRDPRSVPAGLPGASHLPRQYEQAILFYKESMRLNPGFATGWYNLGLAYSFKGDRAAVIEVYQHLKELDPATAEQLLAAK